MPSLASLLYEQRAMGSRRLLAKERWKINKKRPQDPSLRPSVATPAFLKFTQPRVVRYENKNIFFTF
jgi:hypothetical protein